MEAYEEGCDERAPLDSLVSVVSHGGILNQEEIVEGFLPHMQIEHYDIG